MPYIALEVSSKNFRNVSFKAYIYSFRILLLEIVGGMKNADITIENNSQSTFHNRSIISYNKKKTYAYESLLRTRELLKLQRNFQLWDSGASNGTQ